MANHRATGRKAYRPFTGRPLKTKEAKAQKGIKLLRGFMEDFPGLFPAENKAAIDDLIEYAEQAMRFRRAHPSRKEKEVE